MRVWPLLLAVACTGSGSHPAAGISGGPTSAAPADSLVLRLARGVDVWFTAGRDARDHTGAECRERTVEIRRESRRLDVPLLYTGSVPTRLNDTTLVADLWLNCRPIATYRVDLRTGRPALLKPDPGFP